MANDKRRISGPGAADFLTAEGGEDRPGVSPGAGDADIQTESSITDARNLEPDLAGDDAGAPDTEHGTPRGRDGK